MKKSLYFLCVLALFLNSGILEAKWDYEHKFKVFKEINFSPGLLAIKYNEGYWALNGGFEFWDDSTIICSYGGYKPGALVKINVYNGSYKVFADTSHPDLQYPHVRLSYSTMSKWQNLFAGFEYYKAGIFFFNTEKFSRFIPCDSIIKQVGAKGISQCLFDGNGNLFVAAYYKNGAGLIVSRDTGRTWNKTGEFFVTFPDSMKSYPSDKYSLINNGNSEQIGVYTYPPDPSYAFTKYVFAGTSDMGKSWKKTKMKEAKFHLPASFYPSKSINSADTLYAYQRLGTWDNNNSDDTVQLDVSYDNGLSWKALQNVSGSINGIDISLFAVFQNSQRIYMPDQDGVGLTTNGGITWHKFKTDILDTNCEPGRIKMLDDRRGVIYSLSGWNNTQHLYYFELYDNLCGNDAFDYPTLQNTEGLALKGNAGKIGDYVRLTESKPNQAGSLWHEKPIAFDKSFECNFGFNITDGVNGEVDSTSPGADGIALVISKEIPTAPGEIGGGIGFNGINSAVAIEFDSFINKDREDPNFDHTAVFASSGAIYNNHSAPDCLGTVKIAGKMISSPQRRDVLVKYDKVSRSLNVFIDDKDGQGAPDLSIKDFDFEKYLGSSIGYIGITSSTGQSMENHFISNLSVCFYDKTVLAVDEPIQPAIAGEKAYPNPAREIINIELPKDIALGNVEARIFNQIGNVVSTQMVQIGTGAVSINVSGLANGVYFVRILAGGKFVSVPFVKE